MTIKEFEKKKWAGFECIEFKPPGQKETIECTLLAIDFEQNLFKLKPIDLEKYEYDAFWVRVEYCEKLHKLKIKK